MASQSQIDWLVTQAVSPSVIFGRYATAVGYDEMAKTYGSHWPPEEDRPGELMWTWRDPAFPRKPFDPKDHPAAWLALFPDQFDSRYVHMSRGVWPMWHGHGLGKIMRTWAEDWCRKNGKNGLLIEVLDSNEEHLNNVFNDTYWKECGSMYYPVLSCLFVHELGGYK